MDGVEYYYTDAQDIEVVATRGRGQWYPWHMHTRHWTMGFIRQGAVVLTTARARRRLGGGQQFCVAPYQAHSLHVEPHSFVWVACLDAQGAARLQSAPGVLARCVPSLAPEEGRGLEKALNLSIYADDLCDVSAAPPAPPLMVDAAGGPALRAVLHRILAKPDEPWGVACMAAHAGYSPWHFVRAFQKMTGMTPHAFQLLCRLRVARGLLRADTAAAAAAVSAGFADQSHMHKVFKRHHGLTPGQFKRASVRLEL